VVAEVDEAVTGISRDGLRDVLLAENVLARRYFFPGCHRMEPYRSSAQHAHVRLPETERLVERVLSLPTGTAVGRDAIDVICSILRVCVRDGHRTSALLRRRGSAEGMTLTARAE
jgi:dTDP-4-amino-4,6-dideoxygalactose transaminase